MTYMEQLKRRYIHEVKGWRSTERWLLNSLQQIVLGEVADDADPSCLDCLPDDEHGTTTSTRREPLLPRQSKPPRR